MTPVILAVLLKGVEMRPRGVTLKWESSQHLKSSHSDLGTKEFHNYVTHLIDEASIIVTTQESWVTSWITFFSFSLRAGELPSFERFFSSRDSVEAKTMMVVIYGD